MARIASTTKQGPGLTGRTVRRAVRLGVLAAAMAVGRKTAGGAKDGKARDGQGAQAGRSEAPQGLGAAAGGGPSAGH